MSELSSGPYRFGDLLALARQSWVRQMSDGLAAAGYADYHRSDAAAVRLLGRGPLSIGGLGSALGITRQAARKVATGLERRGFATVRRDRQDARQLNVALTTSGRHYAAAIRAVIDTLDRTLARQIPPEQLAAADAVLRTVLGTTDAHRSAYVVPPPPSPIPRRTSG